jgi:glycine oxidase
MSYPVRRAPLRPRCQRGHAFAGGFESHIWVLRDYLTQPATIEVMQHSGHIAIAGGGIIGLACALALRRRGFEVSVFEAGAAMQEASSAAGGMLAVEDPENPPALLPFSRYSRSLYASFLEEIEALSGQRVPLRTRETVQITRETVQVLNAPSAGVPLSPEEARRLVPGLTLTGPSEADHNYLLLEEASLDPRDLCTALPLAVRAAGVALHEYERVLSAKTEGEDVLLTTTHRTLHADALVNCCGAWAGALDASAAVAPRKGQMLVVAQPDGPRLTRVLRSPEVYLIPRSVIPDTPISQRDDRIVIGATVEDAGYSKLVEPAASEILRKRAAAVWAPAADAPEIESWAGLRPGSSDGLPIIGQIGSRRFLATGHFRNGILLAPGTAHIIADLICGITPAVDLASFTPLRASISAVCDKHFAAAL